MSAPAAFRSVTAGQLSILALLTLIWGINWPIIKLTVVEVPVLTFRSLCVIAGAVGCLALARMAGHAISLPTGSAWWIARVSFFNVTCWNIFAVYGVTLMPSGRASILAFTMPLWATAISTVWLKEELTRRRIAGLILGLCGIGVLIGGDLRVISEAPIGAALMLGAAVTWGLGTAMLKVDRPVMSTMALTGWQFVFGGIPILLLTLVIDPMPKLDLGGAAAFGVVYNMLACFIFCYWAWFKLVDTLPVSMSSVSTLMIPVVGTISGALILSEPVGWQEVAALLLVVTALASVLLPARQTGPAPATR